PPLATCGQKGLRFGQAAQCLADTPQTNLVDFSSTAGCEDERSESSRMDCDIPGDAPGPGVTASTARLGGSVKALRSRDRLVQGSKAVIKQAPANAADVTYPAASDRTRLLVIADEAREWGRPLAVRDLEALCYLLRTDADAAELSPSYRYHFSP